MKAIKTLTYINFKLHRNLLVIGLLSLILYAGFLISYLLFIGKDPGNTLQLSSFLIQCGMLFFMLLGFQFAKKNLKNNAIHEIIGSKIMNIHVTNILFLMITSLLYVFVICITLLTYYNVMSPVTSFEKETILFLIYYWLLPFWNTGIIGYTLGINSNNKIMYVFLIAIWAVLSPTNLTSFMNLIANTQIYNSMSWLENLNMGVYDLAAPYDPFYGFEYNWLKKIMWFLSLLLICFISVFSLKNRKLKVLNVTTVIIILILFSKYPNGYEKKEIDDNFFERTVAEYNYYNSYTSDLIEDKRLFQYNIKKVDLTIENFKNFDVEAVMSITYKHKHKLAFTLYQGFIVSEVKINTGQKIAFTQEGDYLIVNLPDDLHENNQIDLHIKYSGVGSPTRPATSKYVYLPADFGWIPSNNTSLTHFIFNGDILTNSIKMPDETKFRIKYSGTDELVYINLSKKSDGTFEGKTNGVTMILGNLTSNKIEGHIAYYPTSWFGYDKEIESYINKFRSILQKYNEIFNTNYSLPPVIILLPTNVNISYSFVNSFGDKDHIILQINPVEFTKFADINDLMPFQIDMAFGDNWFKDAEDYAKWLMFNGMLGSYLGSSSSNVSETTLLGNYLINISKQYLMDTKDGQKLLNFEDRKLSNNLFEKWKEILLDNNPNDWKQMNEILTNSLD